MNRECGRRGALALLASGGVACAFTWIGKGELPAAPIAVRYLEPQQARDRQEGALDARGDDARTLFVQGPDADRAVAELDDVGRYLRGALGGGAPARSRGPSRFRREADETAPRLALLDPRTRTLEVVAAARRGSSPVSWSPDRRRLLFSQLAEGYLQLFELDLDGGTVRPVTREPDAHPWGCYGPGGRLVLAAVDYASDPPRYRVEVTDPGGSSPRPLTPGPEDWRPACARDGSAVAYVSGRGRDARILVRAPPLSGEPVEVARGLDPAFTPDGRLIVHTAVVRKRRGEGGVRDLWRLRRVRVNGTGRGGFPPGPIDEYAPAVSPDGRLIAYVGVDDRFSRALYLRRIDGSGERILFDDGDALGPVW